MLISEAIAQLEELKKEHGDLPLSIERPTGCFVELDRFEKSYILSALQQLDNGETSLTGQDFVIIKPCL